MELEVPRVRLLLDWMDGDFNTLQAEHSIIVRV